MTPGRWTIVARAGRAQRRPGEAARQRVRVRCVCGYERDVWLQDLQTGRSTGCDSRICAARFMAVEEVRATLSSWSQRELELLSGVVDPAHHHLRDALALLAREREADVDRVVDGFLRGPRVHPEQLVAIR